MFCVVLYRTALKRVGDEVTKVYIFRQNEGCLKICIFIREIFYGESRSNRIDFNDIICLCIFAACLDLGNVFPYIYSVINCIIYELIFQNNCRNELLDKQLHICIP
jgi:hypothetical protein